MDNTGLVQVFSNSQVIPALGSIEGGIIVLYTNTELRIKSMVKVINLGVLDFI